MISEAILTQITSPQEIAKMTVLELEQLAKEVREFMVASVSLTGGHLAPSLGVVDLTIAMLSIFNPTNDKIVWDVGHQAYAYKILTERRDSFSTLRQHNGISGFPNRDESPYDHFGVGHASTSISAALGMAVARNLTGENHHVISVIGDGSLTGGMAYEGLNQAGATEKPFIVILNDNEMSIAKNVGALSLFMSKNLSSRWARGIKKEVEGFLKSIPSIGDDLMEIAHRSKHSFKNFFTPGILFEALHFNYIGAVDGHNITELQNVLKLAASQDKPVLIHVLTQKGKGYLPAESNPELFHGIGKFDLATGLPLSSKKYTYTEAFGEKLIELAEQDERIVAISAAMPTGAGLAKFAEIFPHRFYDVGISEQHAVTFAAGLATQGFKPVVAIYSTFLQRAYDQIVHDVCLQRLSVIFCIDRAGIVGEDGATHQGVYDIAYLRHIPEITLFAPKDEQELKQGLSIAIMHDGPFAIRYPKGSSLQIPTNLTNSETFKIGEGEFLCKEEKGIAVIALGSMVDVSFSVAKELKEKGNPITVFNARFIKPLPEKELKEIIETYDNILIVEEHALLGGFSSAVLEYFSDNNLLHEQKIKRIGIPDTFVQHGSVVTVQKEIGLDAKGIKEAIEEMFK